MNAKEIRLIEMFREAKQVALEQCNGSVWSFIGALESALACEIRKGEGIEGMNKAKKTIDALNKITNGLH